MKACNPVNNHWYYFVDKCLPFGSSISCSHFQAFSDAVAHLVKFRTGKDLVNYLDDYLFAALLKLFCDGQIQIFMDICATIQFPVSLEKTFWGSTWLVFLGMLLDTVAQTVSIPVEKIRKGLSLICEILDRRSRKVTVAEVEKLMGFLNFLCRGVVPGCAFTRRLYALTAGKQHLKQHHHVKLNQEYRNDLEMWKEFLERPEAYCPPFLDFETILQADEIDFYMDAAKKHGFGGYFNRKWMFAEWNHNFITECEPSITYLELFAVTTGILSWAQFFRNKRVVLFCDNMGAMEIINSASSKCKNCMVLVRLITLHSMNLNVRIFAKHCPGLDNEKSDWLSRGKMEQFKRKYGHLHDEEPGQIPDKVWPMEKLWVR